MEREQAALQGLPVDDVNGDYDASPRDDRQPAEDRAPQHEDDRPREQGDELDRVDVEAREPEPPQIEPEPQPAAEAPPEADEKPAKKKRTRKVASTSTSRRGIKRTPPRTSASKATAEEKPAGPVIPDVPVVKTGSADKHLVHDEPVEPQPARRPRRGYDLDEIPDDFD